MHRCGSGFLLTLAMIFVAALTGCLGKSSSNANSEGVSSVTLSPTGMTSMDVGSTQPFSATAKNASGGTVLGADIQFIVESGSPNASAPLSIAANGNACAGTWDTSDAICSPGTPGIALVRAVTNGISSPLTTVYVHQHIDSIQITTAESQPPEHDCFSQGQTWLYEGTAYSNKVDITGSVGPISWSFSNSGVVTVLPFVPPNQPNILNQAQTTAKAPGITQIFAAVSGTTSAPFPFTTCLVQYLRLQIGGQSQAGNSITVDNGGSIPVTATAVDTLGVLLETPPLTWSTTHPEVAAFGTITSNAISNSATARANLGGATVFASCTPPTCNIGVLPGLPIYASDGLLPNGQQGYGTISVDVTSTTATPTYTAWAATKQCLNQPGCSSAMFSVTPGLVPIGPILSLPRTPNSMMFNHVSADRVYIGSDQGLMFVDVTGTNASATPVSNSSTCNVALCGTVLAVSNDGKLVVVSDTVSTPSQVYIYNGSSATTAPIDLVIPGETATAAAFSPDQLKIFILTSTGKMYVYSTVDAFTSVPIATSVTDVKFSADGSFAYIAGAPASSVSAFSTCSLPTVGSVDIGSVTASATPMEIFPSPVIAPFQPGSDQVTQKIIALEPPNLEFLTAQFTQTPVLDGQFTCNPPTIQSFTKGQSFNLGQGNFVPVYTQLVANGTEMVIVARKIPAVLLFNVNDGQTSSVPLVGNTDPLAADASTDGSQVYVAACDQYAQDGTTCTAGSVHIVNTCAVLSCNVPPNIGLGDFQQVPYVNINNNGNTNMCNSQGGTAPLCLPDMIAIQPK